MSKWIESTVGLLTKVQRAGGTPAATNHEYYGGEIPFVTIEDITNSSRYLEKTEKCLTQKGLINSAAWLLTKPFILYSMYATVGKPVINVMNCATNQAIIALEENDSIEQLFLYYYLLYIRPKIYKYTAQTTQSNLNAETVKKLLISYSDIRLGFCT
jgi:type I restriction enzyme S subunit